MFETSVRQDKIVAIPSKLFLKPSISMSDFIVSAFTSLIEFPRSFFCVRFEISDYRFITISSNSQILDSFEPDLASNFHSISALIP